MTDIIFWSGFCFGAAIITGVYGIGLLTFLIYKRLKNDFKAGDIS